MFERFTDRARRVVVVANEHARIHRHNRIGTEHLLLALADDETGIAAEVLREHGLTPDAIREHVLERHPDGATATGGYMPFTDGAKRAFEMTLRESLNLGLNYIGTEHILLGISREGKGTGAAILNEVFGGDSLPVLRREVVAKAAARPNPDAVSRRLWNPSLEPTRISIGVDDLFRSRTFYEAIGLPLCETEDHRLIAQLPDGCELELVPSSRGRRTTGLQLRFPVESVERVVGALTAAGYFVEAEAEGHTRTAVAADPDLNTVTLTEKPTRAA